MGRSKCRRKAKDPCSRRGGIFSSILSFFHRPKRCARCPCGNHSKRQSNCCQSTPCCSRVQYATSHPGCGNFSQYPPQGCVPPSTCCHQPMSTFLPRR